MKMHILILFSMLIIVSVRAGAQRIYHTSGAEFILSGSSVDLAGSSVNSNLRFTAFFHTQQLLNLDLSNNIGLFAGAAIRNIGLISEDVYQKMGFVADESHPDWDKNVKMKRRSYSLGFPLALKLGSFKKHFFLYAGGEYEWMFHYKQKFFLDGEKRKLKGWTNERVNSWIPSLFAGIQFPQGLNLKFKYYMDDFINPGFTGSDFDRPVDYSLFESSGIWYISMSFFINKNKVKEILGVENEKTAFRD